MKILLALDGSDGSMVARDLVAALPLPTSTEVHLLAAYQVPTDWAPAVGAGLAWMDDAETALTESLDDTLRSLAAPLIARRLSVVHHVIRGRAASAIVETARSIGADLIVTGSRGRGALATALLGSVAAEVAAEATCPVLVARQATIARLLVATDGSSNANHIPERLAAWGVFRGVPADVVAVSISNSPTFELVIGLYTLGDERLAAKRGALHERYRTDAESMAARLDEMGIPAVPHVRHGDPASEILDAARQHDTDLVITGSRGLGVLDRVLLGSVARKILTHFDGSVLVMREADPSSPGRHTRRAP